MALLRILAGKSNGEATTDPSVVALEQLLTKVQQEREGLETVLASVNRCASGLPDVQWAVDRADQRTSALLARLDEQSVRVDSLARSSEAVEQVEKRIALLEDSLRQAEAKAGEAIERAATLEDHREVIERLTTLATETLPRIDALRHDVEPQLQALNSLAERVGAKVKALENQEQTVERALVESRRVAEMVWKMDDQIPRLNEGMALSARVDDNLANLSRLHADTKARLADLAGNRADVERAVDQQRSQAAELLGTVEGRLERIAVTKQEIDTFGERLSGAQAALSQVERRLEVSALAADTAARLGETVEGLASRCGGVSDRVADLEQRQVALDSLRTRLDALDVMSKRADRQVDSLVEHRRELDTLKQAFEAFHGTLSEARALADKLGDDKHQLAGFVEQTERIRLEAPALTSSIESLRRDVSEAEAGARRVLSMTAKVDELAEDIEQLKPRLPLINDLQARLNDLQVTSADVDRKLASQLARQAEVDGLKIACDGVSTRQADLQQQLAMLAEAQQTLAVLPERVLELEAEITNARAAVQALRQDDKALGEQQRNLAGIRASADALVHDLARRAETLRGLQEELGRASTVKAELHDDMVRIESVRRDVFAGVREAEDHLEQLAARRQEIGQWRSDVDLTGRAVETVKGRLAELERTAEQVDARIESLAGRDRVVDSVKRQVETIHEVVRKTHEDLSAITAAHADIPQGRAEVQRLLDALAGVSDQMSEVEKRNGVVDEVRQKADAVVELLDDIRATLEAVGEEKATVDHAVEKLIRLEDVIREARGTTKALENERKLAQRIADKVRSVRARVATEA